MTESKRVKGPPCITGFHIPQYYRVNRDVDFCIGAAPRSGSTSLYYLAESLKKQCVTLKETPDTAVCIIRDPIKRIASAWMLLAEGVNSRDPVTNFKTIGRPAFEETVDAVLDDDGEAWFNTKIGSSAHAFAWQPQSELYNKVKNPIWIRLEGIGKIYGLTLPHSNKTVEEKPTVTYRLDELNEFYAEDIRLWNAASTTTGESNG